MDISDKLKGAKVKIKTNFIEKVELTISRVEKSNLSKSGVCLIFTNGTYENYENIFDIEFV